jgi:hypothetical protein
MKKFICILISTVIIVACFTLYGCKTDKSTISCYDIFLSFDGQNTLTGNVAFDYYNDTETDISDLKFNLYPNAYREGATYSPVSDVYSQKAFWNGESFGEIEISEVENCSAWSVGGEDENILTVTLPTPLEPEKRAEITIQYTLTLAEVSHRTGITPNTVNLGNFYPILCARDTSGFVENVYSYCGDPFLSDCANYTLTLELPKEYTPATSGQLEEEKIVGDRKTDTFKVDNARDFAVVLSDKFSIEKANVDGVEVLYYFYSDDNPSYTLNVATSSLEYYSKEFGSYVYPTLSVVQTGFCYGGMEYTALEMISDSLSHEDNIYTIAHETAHQWWYEMVGSDQINCGWQDEGLAEASCVLFFENTPSYGFTRTGIIGSATKSYRAFYSVYSQIFGDADTTMNRSLSDFESEYEYTNIAYNKGLILFDTLKNTLGEEKFLSALKSYYSQNLYKIASYEDIISAFLAFGDCEGLFNSFIQGKIVL